MAIEINANIDEAFRMIIKTFNPLIKITKTVCSF
jgi:hypothetical protein